MKQFSSKNGWLGGLLEGLAGGAFIIVLMAGYVLFGLLYDFTIDSLFGSDAGKTVQSQEQTKICTPMLDKFGKFMGCG